MLEVERLAEPFEQPLPAAEHHRRDDDGQLVDVPRGQRLADEVRAAHQHHLLAPGRGAGLLDRLGEVAGEGEPAAVRLLAGPVGDDEQRNVPRVGSAPGPSRLVGAPAGDDRAVRPGHLVQVRLVFAGRLALAGGFVAPRPAEHPVVQPLAAHAQAAARAVVRPGDVPVHRYGDPGHDLAHHCLLLLLTSETTRPAGSHRPGRVHSGRQCDLADILARAFLHREWCCSDRWSGKQKWPPDEPLRPADRTVSAAQNAAQWRFSAL